MSERTHLLVPAPGERRRKLRSALFIGLCGFASIVVLLPLLSILIYVIRRGAAGLSLSFFTELPKPVGETGGGMGNAVVGTLTLIAIASAIGMPATAPTASEPMVSDKNGCSLNRVIRTTITAKTMSPVCRFRGRCPAAFCQITIALLMA